MKPEVTIYYQEGKKASEPGSAYFQISGKGLRGLNGSEIAHSGEELEKLIAKLAKQNRGLRVRNRIPFVNIPEASLLEVDYGDFLNKYRTLTLQEIPESVRALIK